MKFLAALSVSTVLSTLALTATSAPATVYFFSHGRPSTSNIAAQQDIDNGLPSLTTKETRATLSHLLNLGQVTRDQREGEEAFIDMNGPIQQVFNQPGMARKNLFERMGGNLMMAIEGVHDPKELMSSYDPAFTMKSSESVQGLMTELSNRVPFEDRYLFDTHQSSKSGDASVNERMVAERHTDVDVTAFDLSKKADALFLEESVSLGNYLEAYGKAHSEHGKATDFVRITVKGLSALAAEYGVDSVQYKTGQQILKEFLQATFIPEFEKIHKTFTATIFLVAPSTRQESELFSSSSSFRQPLMKRALPASGQCFETAADCETNTNGCSQHGTCVLSTAANCYHCKCSKVNNTQYGGNVCNKVDISIQFHLFFWLGLVLVMTVAMAVGLILQMGNQSEGGVPVGPTRAQLKRD